MPMLEWDQNLETGDNELDGQHQELYNIINSLYDAIHAGKGPQHLRETLEALNHYIAFHFRTEEKMMLLGDYHGYEKHKSKHDEFTNNILQKIHEYHDGELLFSTPVMLLLKDWFETHIREEDQKFITWLKTKH